MIGKIRKDNETLNTLLLSILGIGIIIEIIGLFFANNVINFTISLWIGVVAALVSAVHMCVTIEAALSIGEQGATHKASKYLITHNLIRYGILVVVFAVILFTQTFHPIITFIGLMTLKVGAYLQPFTHKLLQSKKK